MEASTGMTPDELLRWVKLSGRKPVVIDFKSLKVRETCV
jgi:hypothetical protein